MWGMRGNEEGAEFDEEKSAVWEEERESVAGETSSWSESHFWYWMSEHQNMVYTRTVNLKRMYRSGTWCGKVRLGPPPVKSRYA